MQWWPASSIRFRPQVQTRQIRSMFVSKLFSCQVRSHPNNHGFGGSRLFGYAKGLLEVSSCLPRLTTVHRSSIWSFLIEVDCWQKIREWRPCTSLAIDCQVFDRRWQTSNALRASSRSRIAFRFSSSSMTACMDIFWGLSPTLTSEPPPEKSSRSANGLDVWKI